MLFDPAALDPDPVRQFDAWLTEAADADVPMADAFALATAEYLPDGAGGWTPRRLQP